MLQVRTLAWTRRVSAVFKMTNLCIGGSNSAALEGNQSAQNYLAFFGYSYNPNDPLIGQYQATAASVCPKGLNGTKFYTSWLGLAQACMMARAVLFCSKTPGDCSPAFSVQVGAGQGVQVAAASTKLALQGASIGESIAGVTATSVLGLATLGIGAVLGPILSIFSAHAQAVAEQANALCTLCPKATETILQIDEAVGLGQVSPQEGVLALQQLATQFKQAIANLTNSCNAFCAYGGILDAIAAISPAYYLGAPAPAPAPVQYNQNVPVTGNTYSSSAPSPVSQPPVTESAYVSSLPGGGSAVPSVLSGAPILSSLSGVSPTLLLLILAAIVLALVI